MKKPKVYDRIGNHVKSERSTLKTNGFRAIQSLKKKRWKVLIIFVNPLFFLATSASKGFQLIFEDILQKLTYFYLCEFLTDFDEIFCKKSLRFFSFHFCYFQLCRSNFPNDADMPIYLQEISVYLLTKITCWQRDFKYLWDF